MDWQEATFGSIDVRSAEGCLNHLCKEVTNEIMPYVDRGEQPPISEYADVQILLNEAVWRSGYTPEQLLEACNVKLEVNKQRTWKPPNEKGIREHVTVP